MATDEIVRSVEDAVRIKSRWIRSKESNRDQMIVDLIEKCGYSIRGIARNLKLTPAAVSKAYKRTR